MKTFFRVVAQTEPQSINTQNGPSEKSTIVLQELGGKYENNFAASLLGNQVRFLAGDLVLAALRFTTHEHNGLYYQDITIQEISSFSGR